MQIQFIATIAVIAADPPASRKLYVDGLGLPLTSLDGGEYYATHEIEGTKHFAVWPLEQAAQACFGASEWPAEHPTPQVSIEFEVADAAAVSAAAEELEANGHTLLHGAREEPWGQTVARLLTIEGSIIGVSYAPSLHD